MKAGWGYQRHCKARSQTWLALHTAARVDAGWRNVNHRAGHDTGAIGITGTTGAFGIVLAGAATTVGAAHRLRCAAIKTGHTLGASAIGRAMRCGCETAAIGIGKAALTTIGGEITNGGRSWALPTCGTFTA